MAELPFIRDARPDDFLALAKLDREAWLDYPNGMQLVDGEHTWRHWAEHAICMVAENTQGIIGAAIAYPCLNGTFCVHKVMVAKRARAQGIGRALLEALLTLADKKRISTFLTVSPANTHALNLYRKLGFRGEEITHGYYRPDEHRYELHRPPQTSTQPGFTLHPQLAADCITLAELPLCSLLLMNDARFPWVILVPRRKNMRELHDLEEADYLQVCAEIRSISHCLKQVTQAVKINVAALGNQVPQLHIHIIARRENDAAWPKPIWGIGSPQPYDENGVNAIRQPLVHLLSECNLTKM